MNTQHLTREAHLVLSYLMDNHRLSQLFWSHRNVMYDLLAPMREFLTLQSSVSRLGKSRCRSYGYSNCHNGSRCSSKRIFDVIK